MMQTPGSLCRGNAELRLNSAGSGGHPENTLKNGDAFRTQTIL
jgi:hypothetical protein